MHTVLKTGTSSGIGEAAANALLADGWNVVATAPRAIRLGKPAGTSLQPSSPDASIPCIHVGSKPLAPAHGE
jgi:NADP-dependent 3-hydroxy acid dehydrogenase YdfG